MRFSLIHKLTSYLMVLAALASLWFTAELSTFTKLASLLAVVLSWFAEPPRFPAERFTPAWNIATVLFLAYQAVEIFNGASVIHAGVYFLLFVLVNKMFNRVTSKDYRQAYVISFLVLVVATTLNTDISYAVCFAAYVLFAVWALTLFHLRREMEENYLLRHSEGAQSEKVEVERILNSRRIVGLPFLAGTSLVTVGVLLAAATIFFLFPRVGFGLFLGHRRGGVMMVGFRERVELGHHGVVRDNPQVVMRVMLPNNKPPTRPLYWRGSVYDAYDGGVWSHGSRFRGLSRRIVPRDGLHPVASHAPGLRFPVATGWIRDNLLRQEIYLEPLDSTVIFAADRPIALEIPRPSVGHRPFFVPRRTPVAEIRASRMRTSGVRYVAYSHAEPVPAIRLTRARQLTRHQLEPYLQLPNGLPARIGRLAKTITADAATVHAKVTAVKRYLRSNYAYSLNLTHDPQLEPVDEFLFETKRGHCEYFASAMALLLRHLGIHTRQVNGFVGGAWNSYGNYLAVRHGDAHAWVEVLYSNLGWVTVDPTPSGSTPDDRYAGWTGKLTELMDAARLRWFRYVVEYDLGKQVSLLQKVGEIFRPKTRNIDHSSVNLKPLLWPAGALGMLLIVALLWRRFRGRLRLPGWGPARQPLPPVTRAYQQMLLLLARAGMPRGEQLTPREYAARLAADGFVGAELVQQITEDYNSVRFGRGTYDAQAAQKMADATRRLKRKIKEIQ